jgi:hypothetical protein
MKDSHMNNITWIDSREKTPDKSVRMIIAYVWIESRCVCSSECESIVIVTGYYLTGNYANHIVNVDCLVEKTMGIAEGNFSHDENMKFKCEEALKARINPIMLHGIVLRWFEPISFKEKYHEEENSSR